MSRVAVALLALLAFCSAAFAERRIALVIGNDAYRNLSPQDQLRNAVNDARAVRAALEGLGFTVIPGENMDRAAMVERLSDFAGRLQPGDLAFFFFAGHGVSLNGANYILPSDIAPPRSAGRDEEDRLADLAVAETRILDRIVRSGSRVAVVVLDACRNNPLAAPGGRAIGATRGLAPPPETRGVLSIYSAGAGQQALDRLSEADGAGNSLFTRVFLEKLKTPGRGLRALAFETQEEVASLASRVGREQTPGVYSQIIGEVYLAGAPTADRPANARPAQELAKPILPPQQAAALPISPSPAVASGPCGGVTLASLGSRAASPLSANEECALEAKAEFRECENCPTMVVVPPGSFTMGSPQGEEGTVHDEGPQHKVTISRSFAVGKFEVTFDEWDACVADGGCGGYRPKDQGWGRGRHPVINVSWKDAQAYTAWLSRKTGKSYRLLTEAEWEYAARGGTTTPFWFGSSISTEQANYNGNYAYNGGKMGEYREKTVTGGSFKANPFGLNEVLGNAWEWVEDCYHESYSGAPTDGSAWTMGGDCGSRALRGGSWNVDPRNLRAGSRYGDHQAVRYNDGGFRMARTLTP